MLIPNDQNDLAPPKNIPITMSDLIIKVLPQINGEEIGSAIILQ